MEDKYQPMSMTRARCTYEYHHMSPTRPLLSRTQQMMIESPNRYSPKLLCSSRNNYPLQLYYGSPENFNEEQFERSNTHSALNSVPQTYSSIPSSGYIPSMKLSTDEEDPLPLNLGKCGEHISFQNKDTLTKGPDKNDPIYLYNIPSSEESEVEYEVEESFKFRSKPRKIKTYGARRVMEKNGYPNIRYKNVSERRRRFISDLYTTLIDSNWSMTLLLFALSFYITWVTFAFIYFGICWIHGDFLLENLPGGHKQTEGEWIPCVLEMRDFASAFLFSLETQHTIGYGSRQTTNECPEAITIMSLQSVLGCLIQAFMVGLVFAKLSRPKHRANTVVFSKNGVVCVRDKQLCMIFRVGDMRHDSFIVGAQISLKLIRRRGTMQGEIFDEITPLHIHPNTVDESCLFLIWPLTVIHKIDEDSPFYKMNPNELASSKFELSLTLEGTIESTSMTFQARTSYMPAEILWGNRFEPMILYRNEHKKYQVNFSAFHSTYEVETPVCSAYEFDEVYKAKESRKHQNINRNNKPATPPQFHSCIPKNVSNIRSPRNDSHSNSDIQQTSHPNILNNCSNSQDKINSESSATSAASTSAEPSMKHLYEVSQYAQFSESSENVPDI